MMSDGNGNGGWRKSSWSINAGNCVEVGVAESQAVIAVRDTQAREGVTLTFPVSAWRAFTSSLL
jgi:hypothetical protein